jgi:hypothetical protein
MAETGRKIMARLANLARGAQQGCPDRARPFGRA